ncbi:MAG: type II secretion system protein [Methylobacter sp.]|nr:type II secretion system protein [Methylobacter sp.]
MMPAFRRERGYSMVEMAVVIVTTGIITAAAMSAYRPTVGASDAASKTGEMIRVNAAIIAFAQRNHRLPCADDNADGIEGSADGIEGSAGVCTAGSYVSGGVPYVTLGVTPPAVLGTGAGADLVYAVYRNSVASPDADLASLIERNGDAPAANNYRNSDDLMIALVSAASVAVSPLYLNITGDGAATGVSNCATNTVANVAFALISGGSVDMDKNNSIFDGPHNGVSLPTGNNVKCFAPPTLAASSNYDDKVIVTTFEQLISFLKQ